jgi:hypothetical protein
MPSFGLTPINPFPGPEQDFPTGIQFQDEGVDVGGPNPTNVNFTGLEVTATYNPATDTVNVDVSGGGSGGGTALITFSASLTTDQTSGTTLMCDNMVTDGGEAYSGYDPLNGILTVAAGDGGVWDFGATVVLEAGSEVSGSSWNFDIRVGATNLGASPFFVLNGADQQQISAHTGPVRVADATQISIILNQALSSNITSGVRALGTPRTRFWAVRLSD